MLTTKPSSKLFVLRGLKSRHSKLGDVPILIHISGTGVLADNARGEYASDAIYSGLNIEQLKSIPPHHSIDLLVVDADEQGYTRMHVILPSTIYGIAKHALAKAGVSNYGSLQIPALINASLSRGRAGVVGKGLPWWPNVHINDSGSVSVAYLDVLYAAELDDVVQTTWSFLLDAWF